MRQRRQTPVLSDHAKSPRGCVSRAGARVLCGGKRHGAIYEATLLEHVPWDAQIVQDEAFGPVACLFPYKGYKKAIEMCAAVLCMPWLRGSGAALGLLSCGREGVGSSSGLCSSSSTFAIPCTICSRTAGAALPTYKVFLHGHC